MDVRRPLRHQTTAARAFLFGVCCGLAAGAALVWLVFSQVDHRFTGWRARAGGSETIPTISPIERPGGGGAAAAAPGGSVPPAGTESPTGTSGAADPAAAPPAVPVIEAAPAAELADRDLLIPVQGVSANQLVQSFSDRRGTARHHEAIDILAPRGTPVLAVEDGTIARLFYSEAGGTTLYQFDPSERFCYYYAHLDRYADGLAEGQEVSKGQVIGYVGISGNAPKDTPHLHFAIFRMTSAKQWWEGTPIDPFEVLRGGS